MANSKPRANTELAGDNGDIEYGWRTAKSARTQEKSPAERRVMDSVEKSCRIYFPTRETVAASRGGLGVRKAANHWFRPIH